MGKTPLLIKVSHTHEAYQSYIQLADPMFSGTRALYDHAGRRDVHGIFVVPAYAPDPQVSEAEDRGSSYA